MNRVTATLISTVLTFGLASCANRTSISEEAANQKIPPLAELNAQLAQGKAEELNVLSPQNFNMALKSQRESLDLAKAGKPDAAKIAEQGLSSLRLARENEKLARYNLEDVLAARKKAVNVNANKVIPDLYAKAENGLLRLTNLIEKDKLDEAKAGRNDITRLFLNAELVALKGNIVDQARDAYEAAKRSKITNFAPKTLALAQEEYQLALNTLDADRTDTSRAQVHAQKSLWHTRRAENIASMITNFDQSSFNEEDKVLWYQEQLAEVVKPMKRDLSFDQSNKELVKSLNAQLSGILNDHEIAIAALQKDNKKAKEREITMNSERDLILEEKNKALLEDQAIKSKFDTIQAMFTSKEADVYRQLNNVLIRAHGFNFPSGKSDIRGENYALVNKIIKAIGEFPEASIVVSGHTDDKGSSTLNQLLSEQRADEVARIFVDIGRIAPDKISVLGYGEQRPVANNETIEGRASNRRVEVLINNAAEI